MFAYGVTGSGKTFTCRGGKSLADRGIIPRLLSGIYRRCRKIEKDSKNETKVNVTMSYYEIYNDKVFDLFEAPERRTMAGLSLRDNGGKTVVVGLTERPCESLKDFEKLYDQANVNRSTSATKLNAHSSRSHAILCVKLTITTGEETRVSTACAIDLAGSEDNRRTDNNRERLVESSSINKSLFVLAQCVEAISKKASRIPYRESKMTRILSLGQNNGLTIMILNLAPIKSYHLDTLSSLNFANRTKKVEVREVENEPIFKGCSRPVSTFTGPSIQRQPLRPLNSTLHNVNVRSVADPTSSDKPSKPAKAFSVYADKSRINTGTQRSTGPKRSSPAKRPSDSFSISSSRPQKLARPTMSQAAIEDMVEKKVCEMLATRALNQPVSAPTTEVSEEVKRRLELLEQKIEGKDEGRSEGLTFLLMAKQHHARGEDSSALKMYELARDYFPDNAKLESKITKLRQKIAQRKAGSACPTIPLTNISLQPVTNEPNRRTRDQSVDDGDYQEPTYSPADEDDDYTSDAGCRSKPRSKKPTRLKQHPLLSENDDDLPRTPRTPRTRRLLYIINSRDVSQIRLLKGVGARKAEAIVEALCANEEEVEVGSLRQLGRLRGVGVKTVENMRTGLAAVRDDCDF